MYRTEPLITTPLSIQEHSLTVEVALNLQDKMQGLKGRSTLGPDQGMLFIFNPPEIAGISMLGVSFPLSIGFISSAWTLIGFRDLAAESPEICIAPAPIQAFLEVPLGWFTERDIQTGAALVFPERPTWLRQSRPIGFRCPD